MKRGEIWTQSGGAGYAGKPRPALILQSDFLSETESVITCLFTTHDNEAIPSRVPFHPSAANGLREASDLMTDKIASNSRDKLGHRIGAASADDMERVRVAVMLVLGFAG